MNSMASAVALSAARVAGGVEHHEVVDRPAVAGRAGSDAAWGAIAEELEPVRTRGLLLW
jgi:hypothetical protein